MTGPKTRVTKCRGGRLVIPASYRKALGIKPGDEMVLVLGKGEMRVLTRRQVIQRAQALVRRYFPRNRSLSEELISERRGEASRD